MATLNAMRRVSRGFTLVELMIVLAIIALMTGMLVVMLADAQQDANRMRTAAQVRRIDSIVQEQWEETQYRSVRFNSGTLTAINAQPNNVGLIRAFKMTGTRELYRTEFPDRIPDLAILPLIIEPSSKYVLYRERILQLYSPLSTNPNVVFGTAPNYDNGLWTRAYEGAECLFLILSCIQDEDGDMLRFFNGANMGDLDGNGLPNWGGAELGDTDNDGMPEIIDQWGSPVEFIRWAPGFASPLQDQNAVNSPDPLDPYRIDPRWTTPVNGLSPYLLMPLVFSAGPDAEYGVAFVHDNYSVNDPYAWDSGNSYLIGTPNDLASDNIDNHWDIR